MAVDGEPYPVAEAAREMMKHAMGLTTDRQVAGDVLMSAIEAWLKEPGQRSIEFEQDPDDPDDVMVWLRVNGEPYGPTYVTLDDGELDASSVANIAYGVDRAIKEIAGA